MTKETYLKSVDVLLDAYNNGKLLHGNCMACAVGNLLETSEWSRSFNTEGFMSFALNFPSYNILKSANDAVQITNPEWKDYYSNTVKLCNQKGFTVEEIQEIEFAFESSICNQQLSRYYYIAIEPKKGQFIGLCAVLDVMKDMVEEPVEQESAQSRIKLNEIYDKFVTV